MTLRQVSNSIISINEEIKSDKQFNASIHNVPINFEKKTETKVSELSQKQTEAIEKDREAFFNGKI